MPALVQLLKGRCAQLPRAPDFLHGKQGDWTLFSPSDVGTCLSCTLRCLLGLEADLQLLPNKSALPLARAEGLECRSCSRYARALRCAVQTLLV